VLGSGRGLQGESALLRSLAGIDVDRLLDDKDLDLIIAAFLNLRDQPCCERTRLRTYLAECVADSAWDNWWQRGLDSALHELGLGSRKRSPWLLSEHHPELFSAQWGTHRRTIHITDLGFNRAWAGDGAEDFVQVLSLRSLCGLGAKHFLSEPSRSRNISPYALRGAWRKPSLSNACRCPDCVAAAVDLVIPALKEGAAASVPGSCEEYLLVLARTAEDLLEHATDYEAVYYQLSDIVRATVVNYLANIVRADPIPIVMAALTVRERAHLAVHAQTRVHALLQTLDWQELMEATVPDNASGQSRLTVLHDRLLLALDPSSF
jgi:hypothetical protein